MQVRLLYFSVLRDITQRSEESRTLPDHVQTVAQLLQHLYQQWPALQSWDKSLLIAVNQVYAKGADPLVPNAEIALMPPVQGG
jgi:molybdopterin synthase sulfur carrier subunit